MNALSEIKTKFAVALAKLIDDPTAAVAMIRPAGDAKFGDYQANCAMSLGNQLGKPPREIAADLVADLQLESICDNIDIAGPGFINLTLSDQWIKTNIAAAFADDRLGHQPVVEPKTYIVDFSSPNVAKPLHVGHIRSTVIGDSIAKVLRFKGHKVITDNHLGDWGTQFGMIIYGYKHFLDESKFAAAPIQELSRLYRFVRKLMDYHAAVKTLPQLTQEKADAEKRVADLESHPSATEKKQRKKQKKELASANSQIKSHAEKMSSRKKLIDEINASGDKAIAADHVDIAQAVLLETAALHAGDEINRKLWQEFLPVCRQEIQKIYQRLEVEFDYQLGESFYHDQLSEVVADLEAKGFAQQSDGATCIFLDNHATPMIIQKRDGAFLYATTDLATIKYRVEHFDADASLYVVDHRQSEHFEKLFDVARQWGYDQCEMAHVAFGTVMGKDGKPFQTRSTDTIGLEGLLNEAESQAAKIAIANNPDLTPQQLAQVATTVGLGGIKYADLSHNRTSDYEFDYEKMLADRGNTATYLLYAYARVQGIFRKTETDVQALRQQPVAIEFESPIERQLAVKLLQFSEAVDDVLVDYRPNILCNYLFETAQLFARFFDQCSVKDAASPTLRTSRLQLCDLTARTMKTGLQLLGIQALDKM